MTSFRWWLVVSLALPCSAVSRAHAGETSAPEVEVGIEEHLGRTLPLNLTFFDEAGEERKLGDLLGRPTILALVYYECPGICTPLLNGLTEVLGKLELKPGVDYQVLTISFDPTETPEMARGKKHNYLSQFKPPFPEDAWHFMTGTQKSIERITDAVGFRYKRQGEEDFVHGAVLTVLSPEGKIARYLYGVTYLPFDVQMALTEAATGQSSASINRVLLYCFNYDPSGHRYLLSITRIVAAVTLLFVGSFGLWLFLSGRRRPGELGDPRFGESTTPPKQS